MEQLTQILNPHVDESSYLNSFVSDLMESMSSLRKQTPSTLTKDNKETVKHLNRKRKLFADTLKEVRQMGFRSNLSTDALVRQASLSAVLARTPQLRDMENLKDLKNAEYHLHKTLDVMPRVRSATTTTQTSWLPVRSHAVSGTLRASFPFIEAREMLAFLNTDIVALDGTVEKMQNLWVPQQYAIQCKGKASLENFSKLHKTILWLPSIIDVGCNIIRTQNKLATLTRRPSLKACSHQKQHRRPYYSVGQAPRCATRTVHVSTYSVAS
jgi:midasin